jgi:structure-specific recognition protein 1
MRGQKYDYKIKYDDISRLFLLPKPDDVHMAFVIALDKPIRQGQQRYQHLVLQTSKDPDEVTVNLDEETIKKEYGDDLQPVMRGSLSNLVAKTFKVIAKKKVFIPGKFANANQQSCVKCALRANEGLLYPLEKQFVFIHKPPVLVRFNEIESVEFQRYAGGQGSTRNFDLCVSLKATAAAGQQEYTFSGIDRSDYAGLYNFLSGKNIKIKNLQDTGVEMQATAPVYNEDEIYGGPDEELGEESEDEDYDEKQAAQDDEGNGESEMDSEDDIDDDEMGSEIDDDLNSDLEEHRGSGGSKKKKKKAAAENDDDDDDMIEDDLPAKKRKKSSKKDADDSPKKKKPKKDPNAPKKALSSYMIFMSESRARIKEENPDATFGDLVCVVLLRVDASVCLIANAFSSMLTTNNILFTGTFGRESVQGHGR